MNMSRQYTGSAPAATGVLTLEPAGYPAHMRSTATRMEPGSASSGDQRVKTATNIFAADLPNKSVVATITGTATLHLQGTNDDPNDSGANWVSLGNITATGSIASTTAVMWVRLNKTAGTGTLDASLFLAEE